MRITLNLSIMKISINACLRMHRLEGEDVVTILFHQDKMTCEKDINNLQANKLNATRKGSPSTEPETEKMKGIPYVLVVGSLMYAMGVT